ncbi:MAG TPA: hypothetical protein PKE45_09205 [Caldilineaceae bacterium]|nr:hypothetical protein [Caldilineaceae bacterium]
MLLTGAFFLFPIAHTRWGDAYLLSKSISWPDPALRLTYSWQAPLDVFIHSQLWLWGHVRFGWEEATPVYRLLSPLAGLVYLGATLALGRHEQLWPAWLVFALLTTLGLVQLFFGYVENYSLAAAGLLVYLYFGLETLQGRQTLWPAAIALALTNALHPSTVVLAPSLFYLGWCKVGRSRERNKSPWPVVYSIVIPMLFVALGTILLMERGGHGLVALLTTDRPGGGDARPFVPLWNVQTRWEQYTMFSWLHLRDLLNQQGLVAPVVWPAIIWLSIVEYRSARIDRAQAESHLEPSARSARATADLLYTRYTAQARLFLAIAALSYLLFICVWNPDYGGQRDWDLFSLSALPATLWLAALLTRALQYRRYLLAGAAPLILLQAWHTGSWVYQNTLPWLWP